MATPRLEETTVSRDIFKLGTLAVLAALVVGWIVGVSATAQAPTLEDRVQSLEDRVTVLEDEVFGTASTSTTSTLPPSSTTTTVGTTTTILVPPVLQIPATLPYPERGSGVPYEAGGGYDIFTLNGDTGTHYWTAPYWGSNGLPYAQPTTWLDGDRSGYRCAYGFLEHEGELVGRFTFIRVEGAGYARVIDRYMAEGQRYYDGSPSLPGDSRELGDCPFPDEPYEEWDGPDERPRVGFFNSDGEVLDIRDYRNTVTDTVKFRLFSVTDSRVTVVAYEADLPIVVVYYDALGSGQIAVDFGETCPVSGC